MSSLKVLAITPIREGIVWVSSSNILKTDGLVRKKKGEENKSIIFLIFF